MPANKTLLGSFARTVLTWLSRQRLPQVDGEISLSGLDASVDILRDQWGIPHIYAQSLPDALFAQGFVHAQDRLFQMELNRRTAQGTLSEIFGEIALDTDRTARTFGFNRLGLADWDKASAELKEGISAYVAGVNAFLDHPKTKLPVEFTLLGFKPQTWTPEDTMAFTRVMMWQLSHAWQGEIIKAEIIEKVGAERAAELEIHFPKENPVSLPKGIEFNTLDPDGSLRKSTGPFLERGKGSNAWAISPPRSETGNAVLCNDMHLALSMPSLWYEVHLNGGDDLHATGVSLPGVPMVLVGHNDHMAWGMTLAFTDAEDLFMEQVDSQNRYLYKDDWHDAEIIEESISVKGRKEPHIEKVIITRHGPIISDVVSRATQKVAVNSMALRPSPAFDGWLKLNKAKGWDDFVEAMRLIEAPQLNVAYADVQNNIGYWVTGKVPVRAKGDGSVPVPGWSGEYEWIGEVPFEEMPHALNPESGYLVSCNHKIVPDDYPHYLGNVWMNGYRARRLVELIEGNEKLTMGDHQKFHMDVKCLPGLELVARLEGITDPEADVQTALKLLREWDGFLSPESVPGMLYEVIRYALVRNLLEPGLGTELSMRLMGEGFHPLLMHSNEFYGQDTVILLRLLDNPDSWWVQQAGARDDVIIKSIKQAVAWLRENLGSEPDDWVWGKIHQVNFEHPLGLQKPLDQVFNRGPYPIGGDTDTPCQTAMLPHDPYDNKAWSPTFRQIVDMGDLSNSVVIVPPGQSENVASPNYDDLIQPWLDGEYHPMLWTREQVEKATVDKITLRP
ncbi:MAG: penicillin acylase family protein [Anaerolineales bacterium]|nr:penicillin acylase family protein [Chloroflexota bacterium]MBL6979564.1 penicillin acylase family protein [Anaerolineales bacterium]